MPTSAATCPDCLSELPVASRFCPSCGARTPQHTVATTGELASPKPALSSEAAHRARLQRALGDGLQITRLIGRGGFAEVYAVLDVGLRREVAVKTLRHDIEVSAQMIQRFRREAESVARLRHPNIVPIYQVGEGEGLVYFTMPVIEGESLAAAIVRGESFSVADTCRILREVAGALGAAHRTGVVHRDVKPDNIMLEGPERRAVVMDFGIAKLADAAEARLTGTGLLIGSPHYMSPEQAAGEAELDHRSDEYSLAVVGYQMLAGRMPFDSTSVQSILFKQMTETAVPISDIRGDVPPALSAALAKALSKKVEDRFQSMEEFGAALPSFGGGAPMSSARQTLDLRARAANARQIIRQWKWPALAAAVIGLAGATVAYRSTVPAPQLAVASSRLDATFAAKTALPPTRAPIGATEFIHEDSVYRFIYTATGSRAKADSIAADVGVWRWSVHQKPLKGTAPTAEIGSTGRVIALTGLSGDSATRTAITTDSARVLGESMLRARGWQVPALRFVGDSVSQRDNRTDHLVRWEVGGVVLKTSRGTAMHQLQVAIRGDSVRSYREALVLPPGLKERPTNSVVLAVARVLLTVFSCGLAVVAVVLMVRRSRIDELQWKPMFILALACGLPALIAVIVSAVSGENGGEATVSALVIGLTMSLLAAFLLIPAVVGESLLAEHRPLMVMGLGDLSHGQFAIPEIATASLIGYPAGLCVVALSGMIALASQALTGRAAIGGTGSIMAQMAPALTPFSTLAYAFFATMGVVFGVGIVLARRLPPALAILFPAFLVLLTNLAGTVAPGERILLVSDALLLTLITWRFGVVAGILTAFVAGCTEGLITLYVASGTAGLTGAVLATAFMIAPGIMGVVAYRRLPAERANAQTA